jgi:D-alanyl-D-alanine carboxypeptidase/D-alanyl-D-alanine-endopeptidase (penicillin-binding protein 4)
MALLGPDATVETKVMGDLDAKGTVRGDLTLYGWGDANLSDRRIPYESPAERKARLAAEAAQGATPQPPDPLVAIDDLATQVAAKGVRRVTGRVLGDDGAWVSEPYAQAWGIDDMEWGYGAPVSALVVNDNEIELKVMPGAKAGDTVAATLSPDVGELQLEVQATTVAAGEKTSLGIDREAGSRVVRIYGAMAVGAAPDTEALAVPDPARFAAEALRERLMAHGIQVDGAAEAQHRLPMDAEGFRKESHEPIDLAVGRKVVAGCIDAACLPALVERRSVPLAEDVTVTLKVSQNLHAEMMLRRLGQAYGTEGSFAQGARVVRQFLLNAGLDGDDFVFYDGSGLSSHDLVTPRAMAQLLAYAAKQPWFAEWKAALPVGGEDGTLASRFPDPPLKDHLFAKTGTLGESRALSGYLDAASGKQVIFSIMVDDHAPGSSADRVTMDKVVAAIAAAE